MRRLTTMLGCVLVSTSAFAQARVSGLGDDPTKFDQLLDTAFAKRDVVFIETAVADDMRFTHGVEPGGTVWDKQKFLNAVRTNNGLERNVDAVQVEQHGDIIETLGHIQVKTPRSDWPEYQIYFVRLYRRGPGGWQFLSHRTVRETDGPLAPATTTLPRAPETVRTNPEVGTEQGPVRPGNGVSVPRLLREVKPQYTADAMRAKIQGAVLLECVVNTDGTVSNVRVIRSLDTTYGLDEEASKAAKQWRFVPGTRNGEPVPVLISIELTFTLGKK